MYKIKAIKVLIILSMFLLVLLPYVNSQTVDEIVLPQIPPVPQNSIYVIRHSATVNFSWSPNINCNLTILDPRKNVIVNSSVMINNPNTQMHEFTLQANQTTELGTNTYDMGCCVNGRCLKKSFAIEITPSGFKSDTSQSINYLMAFIGAFFLLLLCVIGALRLPKDNNRNEEGHVLAINHWKHLRTFLWFMSYVMVIWIVNILVIITNNFLPLGLAVEIFRIVFFILIISTLLVAPVVVFIIIKGVLKDKEIKKLWDRGFNSK